ncbi:hydrogenase formation protein HypD [Desulfococcus sp.]|uniref:hydrogenase formation protein HypD n=1 Tax=Desulfococcus sp. TaxID=2025834 RepID=UPI003593812A
MKYAEEYRDPEIARRLIAGIRQESRKRVRLMEVCGTHTMTIFRSGIRSVLPETIYLLSGPGCPVCVTDQSEIDAFIEIARTGGVTTATFGDLIRVPGTGSSLERERAAGADVRVVYSALDALAMARKHPDRRVVFLGVGFETTAPTIAAAVSAARDGGLSNFSVFSSHKRVMPALASLMEMDIRIDGFLLPGHVSLVIGAEAYRPLFDRHRCPMVIAGFEPGDVLAAIHRLVRQIESGRPDLENAYPRAVTAGGNRKAQALMASVFTPADAVWRGMGRIPESGLALRDGFEAFDARRIFGITLKDAPAPAGCLCGEVITGRSTPPECRLFRKACTPAHPVGPCMVSSEGTCAAYYRYHPETGDTGKDRS